MSSCIRSSHVFGRGSFGSLALHSRRTSARPKWPSSIHQYLILAARPREAGLPPLRIRGTLSGDLSTWKTFLTAGAWSCRGWCHLLPPPRSTLLQRRGKAGAALRLRPDGERRGASASRSPRSSHAASEPEAGRQRSVVVYGQKEGQGYEHDKFGTMEEVSTTSVTDMRHNGENFPML